MLLIILGLAGAGTLLVLRHYSTRMVHAVVVNAVVQRAPEGYPDQEIRVTFGRRLEKARSEGREEAYIQELMRLSQRLEKIQHLEREEVDDILSEVGDQ